MLATTGFAGEIWESFLVATFCTPSMSAVRTGHTLGGCSPLPGNFKQTLILPGGCSFTVNPRRRIRQHNGIITAGAWKTHKWVGLCPGTWVNKCTTELHASKTAVNTTTAHQSSHGLCRLHHFSCRWRPWDMTLCLYGFPTKVWVWDCHHWITLIVLLVVVTNCFCSGLYCGSTKILLNYRSQPVFIIIIIIWSGIVTGARFILFYLLIS